MNKAVCVGINAYPSFNALNGCINDIQDVRAELIQSQSFAPMDVILVQDNEATAANIKAALTSAVSTLGSGDRFLFWYSGHGAQLTDGDAATDVICPVDFNFTAETSLGVQDFHDIFSKIPDGVTAVWGSDSCHSGDLERGFYRRGVPKQFRHPTSPRSVAAHRTVRTFRDIASTLPNIVLLSGCRSDQTSADADFNGRYNGAFTYFLLQQLKATGGLSTPLSDLVLQVQRALAGAHYEQIPELTGPPALLNKWFLQTDTRRELPIDPRLVKNEHGMLERLVDKAYRSWDVKDLPEASVAAIQGVSEADAVALHQCMHIKTIRDLAENRHVKAAQEILAIAAAGPPPIPREADQTIGDWLKTITDLSDDQRTKVEADCNTDGYQKAKFLTQAALKTLSKKYNWPPGETAILIANLPAEKPAPEPLSIPDLPPKTTFDLTQPTLTTPDGHTFILPPDPPYHSDGSAVISPASIEPAGWMVIAKASGMLFAFNMDSEPAGDNAPTALHNALVWKVPEEEFYTNMTLASVSDSIYTYSEDAFKFVHCNFDSESASMGYAFCAASFERSHNERDAGASTRKTLHIRASFKYPRAKVTMSACTTINPRFETEIRAALKASDDKAKFEILQQVFNSYGHAYPQYVVLGGMCVIEQEQTITASTTEEDVQNTYAAAAGIKVLGGTGSGTTTFQNADGKTISSENIAATATTRMLGGDTTANLDHWRDTIKTPSLWAVIGYNDLTSTINLLPTDLQTQVQDIWNQFSSSKSVLGKMSSALPADTATRASSDGFLLGMVTTNRSHEFSFAGVCASTGKDSDPESDKPYLGLATASIWTVPEWNLGIPNSSFCLPVRNGESTVFRAWGNVSSPAVNFVPMGSGDVTYLGPPERIDLSTSNVKEFTPDTDGFVICSMGPTDANPDTVCGAGGSMILQQKTWAGMMACTSTSFANYLTVGRQSFCVPVQKALGALQISVTTASSDPSKAQAFFVPLSNATLGSTVTKTLDTTYTADSDGFLVGVISVGDVSNGSIRLQSAEPGVDLKDVAFAEVNYRSDVPFELPTTDGDPVDLAVSLMMGTAMIPVRQGMQYRGVSNTGGHGPFTTTLYWVPLKA